MLSANPLLCLKLWLCGRPSLTLGSVSVFAEGIQVLSIHTDLWWEIQRRLLNNFQNCSTSYLFTLSKSGMHPAKQLLHVHTFQNESSSFLIVKEGPVDYFWQHFHKCSIFLKPSSVSLKLTWGCPMFPKETSKSPNFVIYTKRTVSPDSSGKISGIFFFFFKEVVPIIGGQKWQAIDCIRLLC